MAKLCEERVAIITGSAGSGMGRSIALTLAREGADVVINYRSSEASANAIAAHIEQRGGRACAVQADVFKAEGCETLVNATLERFGRVDICIIGPGGGWNPEPPVDLAAEAALQDVRQELATLFYLMPLVLPGMAARGWGRLIGLGLHPQKLSPAYAYNVGKAVRERAMLLAQEQTWQQGVTVNVIAPGPVPAIERLEEAIDLCDHGALWQDRADVTPQDVAEGVAFLCSEAGNYITGCVMPYRFRG
jgi:NAD(P)-dependent dehydrogenase (short-subunit alcohol dehydrogenase family)